MLGRSHALSGAVVWLAGCAATTQTGADLDPSMVAVGTITCAGAALLPDLDHPKSTAARALGPITQGVAAVVSAVSDWVRDRTCGCCATAAGNGHRTLTHTAAGALAMGVVVSLVGWVAGQLTAAVIVGTIAALGVRGLLRRKHRGRNGAPFTGVVAGLITVALPAAGGWWWIGLPVSAGCFVHSLGDALTRSAVPLWWPLRIRGCRWYRCGMPHGLRFTTGGLVELWVVVPVLILAGVGSVWVLA